jgi:hypothetical protein
MMTPVLLIHEDIPISRCRYILQHTNTSPFLSVHLVQLLDSNSFSHFGALPMLSTSRVISIAIYVVVVVVVVIVTVGVIHEAA